MNLKAIADGLAATIGTVTAFGESATATARLPNEIGKLALLVYPPTGTLDVAAQQRNDEYLFPVRLLRDPTDVPARTDALYAWYDALRDLPETHVLLGISPPPDVSAQPVGCSMGIDGERYGNAVFDVVELLVSVRVQEPVTTVGV